MAMISCEDPVSPDTRKDILYGVVMRLFARVRDGIESESDVEAELVCLTCRGFYAARGGNAGHNHLRDATLSQLALEIRVRKCTPAPLGHDDVTRLLVQFRQQIGPILGEGQVTA